MAIARRTNRFINTENSIYGINKENMPAILKLELKKPTERQKHE